MRGKFVRGITAGAMMGAAAGMFLVPQVKRNTRRRIRRNGRRMYNTMENAYDVVMNWMR